MPNSLGAIVGQTPDEARLIQVEGPAGILARSPPWFRPKWEPSNAKLIWPNGANATVFSAAKPAAFRGPQHHWVWGDELAKWPRAREAFDNINFGLRLEQGGREPQALFTTTPRPISVLKELLAKANCARTGGTTFENRANLARSFLDEVLGAYEGTRLGRQELMGELLDDVPGALWSRARMDAPGFRVVREPSDDDTLCVAIDPAASNNESSDETGIIAMGAHWVGKIQRFHVYADASISGSPLERVTAAIRLFQQVRADKFVVETNNGGDWIPALIQVGWANEGLPGAAPVEIVTASRGKHTRAEPIAALYEQGRVTHTPGLEALEDQLCTWSPLVLNQASPDRMDALVWAGSWLSGRKRVVFV